ncbi:CRISPR system precrRNA processing endoribonuclease RAMP protein Cas6 [Streptosporangiaceae bacterium NEAU-GS5]|nr:CRISPR system precrRNA processing endoribonuclease RAMP protein Cas6 [Streptosporangiaceae bacterium NEAU-GS5]
MPSQLILRLHPTYPWRPNVRQAHGLACSLFEAGLGDHAAQAKMFTLWPPAPIGAFDPDGIVFRFSWLGDGSPPLTLAGLDRVRLGNVTCVVKDADLTTESYSELTMPSTALSGTLTFHSPTYFSRDGRVEVLPDPRLMLAGYIRRWNAAVPESSPLHVADDMTRDLTRAVTLGDYELHTMHMDSGYQKDRPGFVGSAELRLPRETSPGIRTVFTTLLRYSVYSGTGAQTTHGYGATSSEISTQ